MPFKVFLTDFFLGFFEFFFVFFCSPKNYFSQFRFLFKLMRLKFSRWFLILIYFGCSSWNWGEIRLTKEFVDKVNWQTDKSIKLTNEKNLSIKQIVDKVDLLIFLKLWTVLKNRYFWWGSCPLFKHCKLISRWKPFPSFPQSSMEPPAPYRNIWFKHTQSELENK